MRFAMRGLFWRFYLGIRWTSRKARKLANSRRGDNMHSNRVSYTIVAAVQVRVSENDPAPRFFYFEKLE